jgi:hypothetical protein
MDMPDDRNQEYAEGDQDFADWLEEVDTFCEEATWGFAGIHDLRDHMWRSAYDAGDSPKEAWANAVCDGILEP